MHNYLIKHIDNSFKKAREIEKSRYPYAVLLNVSDAEILQLDGFTCLSKQGFKAIPIITAKNVNPKEFKIVYTEEEMLNLLKNSK